MTIEELLDKLEATQKVLRRIAANSVGTDKDVKWFGISPRGEVYIFMTHPGLDRAKKTYPEAPLHVKPESYCAGTLHMGIYLDGVEMYELVDQMLYE